MFVQHPEAQGATFSFGGEGGEFLGQRRFEALRCGRVFFGVGLARHFQDPADFSQQRIHTGERQRALGAGLDPRLRFLRPAELAHAQLLEKRRLIRRAQSRRVTALVLARQQAGEPARQKRVQLAEHGRAHHSCGRGDLLGVQLELRHQPHHQQALALPRLLALPPRFFQFRGVPRSHIR